MKRAAPLAGTTLQGAPPVYFFIANCPAARQEVSLQKGSPCICAKSAFRKLYEKGLRQKRRQETIWPALRAFAVFPIADGFVNLDEERGQKRQDHDLQDMGNRQRIDKEQPLERR